MNVFKKSLTAAVKKPFVWLFAHPVIFISLIFFLAGGGYFAYQRYQSLNTQPTYQTTVAEKGTLITSVTASGTILSAGSASITTNTSGVVSAVYVKKGDTVYQGQKIADITVDQSSQIKLTNAWSNLVSAQVSQQNAENNLRSAEASLEKVLDDIHLFQYGNGGFPNVGSANETETQKQQRTAAEVAKDNAYNNVKTTGAALNAAALNYQQSAPYILSPIAGVISNLNLTPGSVIDSSSSNAADAISNTASSQSVGLITVGNVALQAKVNLSEVDVTKVNEGQKVTMTLDAFADKTFTGKITSIDTNGTVSSNVITYPATITFDSAIDGIYPNMAVSATIITGIKDNVILVPSAAVQSINGASVVRVLHNGQVTEVAVESGSNNGTQTEIISGIQEGDQIITSPSNAASINGTTTSPFSGFNRGFGGVRGGGVIRTTR